MKSSEKLNQIVNCSQSPSPSMQELRDKKTLEQTILREPVVVKGTTTLLELKILLVVVKSKLQVTGNL